MPSIERVLAIETSCDDTSVAVVDHTGQVEAVVSANQDLAHAPFGGVVPEIASRNHTLTLLPLVEEALKKSQREWTQIGGVVVTNRPGLVGSLIVGLVTAKSIAQVRELPFLGINHLEGHLLAPFLKDSQYTPPPMEFPFVALTVSGGHTSLYRVSDFGAYEVLGSTLDDAAGEAFDKFGKMLGLKFPAGAQVDQLATGGKIDAFPLPRGMIKEENFLMSFSGLKASAQRLVEKMSEEEKQKRMADLCASFREAVVDVLLAKLDRAVTVTGLKHVVITGGVSANYRLRERGQIWSQQKKLQLAIPPLRYCTDNAAMIGLAGIKRLNKGERSPLTLGPSPHSWAEDFLSVGGR